MNSTEHSGLLSPFQDLPTSGARAVEPFECDGQVFLAVPQLAQDAPGSPPGMNGGDSDVPMPIFRWDGASFQPWQSLPVPGGEDAEFFRIGERAFLATATLRTGRGPYAMDAHSTVFEWRGGTFVPFQEFPTFAAKQWRHLRVGERHFLALAQGVVMPGVTPSHPHRSTIFEWDGAAFAPFQDVPSAWGYNWLQFRMDGAEYVAYADNTEPSVILRWTGKGFETAQVLEGRGGRAFCFFEAEGERYLAFADMLAETMLLRWDGRSFVRHQRLSGPGGREFATLVQGNVRYVVQANFVTGSREAPDPVQRSAIHRFEAGQLVPAGSFPTFGAPDVAAFAVGRQTFLAVAESLSADIRFRTDSHIYRFGPTAS